MKKILIGLASVIVLAFIVIYFIVQPTLERMARIALQV